MKQVLLALLLLPGISSYSQIFTDGSVKLTAAYAHDFPGLTGYVAGAEVNKNLTGRLDGGFGVKRYSLKGIPRSSNVEEYTKATTIDLNMYFAVINHEQHRVKIGGGYTFSFYSIRRTYPIFHGGGQSNPIWNVVDKEGRISGFMLHGEYEYIIPETNISVGMKGSIGKAFDQVTSVGPFCALHF